MRARPIALIAIAIFAAGPAFAQGMGAMKGMAGMAGMARPAHGVKTGHGVGVITAIDFRAATITIKHGAIAAVGWPAMTMNFKANPPALLHGRHVGERIGFVVETQGMAAQVTAIKRL